MPKRSTARKIGAMTLPADSVSSISANTLNATGNAAHATAPIQKQSTTWAKTFIYAVRVATSDLCLDLNGEIRFRADRPYTKKLVTTERTIVMIVCLQPGQVIPPHSHESREAFVYCLQGDVRFTPGDGEAEVHAGEMRFYDGASAISPRNVGDEGAAFLVTLVRKKNA